MVTLDKPPRLGLPRVVNRRELFAVLHRPHSRVWRSMRETFITRVFAARLIRSCRCRGRFETCPYTYTGYTYTEGRDDAARRMHGGKMPISDQGRT